MQIQNYKQTELDLGRKIKIPESWHISKIRDVINDIQIGFASGARDDDGITQLRMNNISDDGNLDFSKLLKVPIPSEIGKYNIKKDDILFNNTNSLDLIGKTAISDKDLKYTFSNHISRIRTKSNIILPYYLYLLLLVFRKQNVYRSICNTHVGQSGIGKSELLKLLIYYPPLKEQQKIASILSNVDSLIQKTDQVIVQTQRLKKGLLQRLLTKGIGHTKFKTTDFSEIPEDWQLNKLIDVCVEKPCYGAAISAIPKDKNLPRYVRITDLDDNGHLKDDDWVSISAKDAKPYLLNDGEFLFARTGATVGKTYLYRKEDGKCAFAGYLIRFIPDKSKLDPRFLFYYTHSIFYWKWLRSIQTEGVQPNVNANQYSNMILPIPSIEEQKVITSIFLNIDNLIEKLQNKKKSEETLKKGLMQQLLTGKVGVKV